jgi:signal transduction histidine kinase/CheY-like chemotaxis protein
LNAISSQAAIALMNAKLFGELMERNRRSKEILEQQLQSAREQLIQSSRLAAMGQLVASVAHDINNPLTAVIGYTEILLLEREKDEQLKKRLEVVLSEANRIAGIVRNLRTFAQKHKIEQHPTNLNHVVTATLSLQEYKLKRQNIEVITDLDADLPQTMADSQQLQQVLINFLSNAMDAMEKKGGGTIKIKTELRVEQSDILRIEEEILDRKLFIRLSVSDDGPGIPEDIRARVFEPFFTTKDEVKGTGLGLSICHGIVSAHNGKIYFKTEIGKGTTFFVEIPLIIPPAETEAGILTESIVDSEATAKKILLVDDELAIQNLLKEFLRPEGQVDIASDGMIGWEKLEKQRYDLIILDIKMPKVDGITLYQRIQREKSDLIQKIIFITGDDFDEKTKSFLEKNKVRYITKPFDLIKLREKIHETLV